MAQQALRSTGLKDESIGMIKGDSDLFLFPFQSVRRKRKEKENNTHSQVLRGFARLGVEEWSEIQFATLVE